MAAYPIHEPAAAPSYSSSSHSPSYSSGGDKDFSPLTFLLIPLVLILLAIPFLALIGVDLNNNNGRSFGGRSSDLDDKFGSFSELQGEIDTLLEKYVAALVSDDCMDRVVCELGVKASGIPHKDMFFG